MAKRTLTSVRHVRRTLPDGYIIPPGSLVELIRADSQTPLWKSQIGRTFRVGYYSRRDGPDCVWLVNDAGEYEQTVDRQQFNRYFRIVQRSSERALFGRNRPPLSPVHATMNGKSKVPSLGNAMDR